MTPAYEATEKCMSSFELNPSRHEWSIGIQRKICYILAMEGLDYIFGIDN